MQFTFKCLLCGNMNDNEFYMMPLIEKVSDSIVNSTTKYIIQCKLCGKNHILELKVDEGK